MTEDENGFLLPAVEAWQRHGIYPPPLCGDPTNPMIVAFTKAVRAWRSAPTEEERRHHLEEAHRAGAALAPARHNLPPVTKASSS